MQFWWFMLLCDLLIPVMMILCGWLMWKHPPKDINGVFGYRTPRSMKNMDTWRFAHAYSGKLWWKVGWIGLLPSALIFLFVYDGTKEAIGTLGIVVMALQMIMMLLPIFATERALKKAFSDDGMPL